MRQLRHAGAPEENAIAIRGSALDCATVRSLLRLTRLAREMFKGVALCGRVLVGLERASVRGLAPADAAVGEG